MLCRHWPQNLEANFSFLNTRCTAHRLAPPDSPITPCHIDAALLFFHFAPPVFFAFFHRAFAALLATADRCALDMADVRFLPPVLPHRLKSSKVNFFM
jgi:hypothetical protein